MVMLIVYGGVLKERRILRLVSAVLGVFPLAIIQLWCGTVENWTWMIGMFAAISVMTIILKYGCQTKWGNALYMCARAFMRAELIAALEWQIYSFYFWKDEKGEYTAKSILFCAVIYIAGFLIFCYFDNRQMRERENCEMEINKKNLILIWILTLFMFALSNLSYTEVITPFTGVMKSEIFNIRTLMDLAGVLMIEIFQILKLDNDTKQEMMAIQNVLRMQYLQYRESQENTELLNRKYHDLKHQIQVIRDESNEKKRGQYLDEIERGINLYDSEIKTGNSVLDTIFTSKSSQCVRLGIKMTVVADGKLLKQIHVMDLCTIFGNALDNAIEYEVQIENPEMKMIHVSISEKQSFVCALVENYYEGEHLKEGELPTTTKADKQYHGYGLKSIRYSVERYHGYFNVTVKDNWFRLELLFPYKELKK